jgi:hypothetical protein
VGFGDPRAGLDEKLRQAVEHLGDEDIRPAESADDHEAHAAGKTCGRCGRELTEADDVRRTADDDWVHETCPLA